MRRSLVKVVDTLRGTPEDMEGLVLSELAGGLRRRASMQSLQSDTAGGGLDSFAMLAMEELMEWFAAETENKLADAQIVLSRLAGRRRLTTLQLHEKRNLLLKINMGLTLCTICFAFCSSISGWYGMNLDNGVCGPEGCHAADLGLPTWRAITIATTLVAFVGGGVAFLAILAIT